MEFLAMVESHIPVLSCAHHAGVGLVPTLQEGLVESNSGE